MALPADKSAKLFRALVAVIDAHLELDRVRAEVYAQDAPAEQGEQGAEIIPDSYYHAFTPQPDAAN